MFCIDTWNKYLADIKRKPKVKPHVYASSELLSGGTPDDSSTATMSPKIPDKAGKSHRRVRSDGYLDLRNSVTLSKTCSEHGRRSQHRSLDDLLSSEKVEEHRNGGMSEKLCDTKVDDLKHPESRFSKMAYGTRKLFKALTDTYKKIEVNYRYYLWYNLDFIKYRQRVDSGFRLTIE